MATFLQRLREKRRAKRARESVLDTPPTKLPITEQALPGTTDAWQVLHTYSIPSAAGNERLAISYVAEAIKDFHLPAHRVDQLGTAVGEATMNAMEHGNHYDPEIPVTLQVLSSENAIAVRISDKGGNHELPAEDTYEAPNIEAKLAELQSPRGWGLFLIQNMVDEMNIRSDKEIHTIELILHREGHFQTL